MSLIVKQQVTYRTPAKLILSGEHSVVHGAKALAVALSLYTTVTVEQSRVFEVIIPEFDFHRSYSPQMLKNKGQHLAAEYQRYKDGLITIKEVINHPNELVEYAIYAFLNKIDKWTDCFRIQIESKIPIGCGLGSSASLIISILKALQDVTNFDDDEVITNIAIEIENLQHGKSSGIDLKLVQTGGFISYDQIYEKLPVFLPEILIVNTGQPLVTTGECVEHVKNIFSDLDLLADFNKVTNNLISSLHENDIDGVKSAIYENQKLLQGIGVVPKRVEEFIARLKELNVAAKVCGAGSTLGDAGGVVVCFGSHEEVLALSDSYGFKIYKLSVDTDGTKIV